MNGAGQRGIVVQRPHRGPAASAVADPPGRQPFDAGALAPAQHLGGHPQQSQGGVGALHGAHRQSGVGGQAGVGGPALPAGGVLGVAGPGRSHLQDCRTADLVVLERRAHTPLVTHVVGDRHREVHPPRSAAGPAPNTGPHSVLELQDDPRRVRRSSVGGLGGTPVTHRLGDPQHPRAGTHHPTPAQRRATAAVENRAKITI